MIFLIGAPTDALSGRSVDQARERFGDAGRLLLAVDLDRHFLFELERVGRHLIRGDQLTARANPRVDTHRIGEAHLVEAVVDPHGEALVGGWVGRRELVLEVGKHREGEKPVGDRGAKGGLFFCPLHVDVDELVVQGGVGEIVDLAL
jgi:hypothetical protein